ncbi:TrmB family transcriptional regulator [Candidatus Woesearchaeota archaeon]|nr:TrmB family transcriptional regulator [Candidatus Woesearchaeota archaeon]
MNKEILKQIGLTRYEAEVYLALLTQGQVSAYELAEKAGLYRQVTYDTLQRLTEKGFVSSVIEEKTKLFRPIDPQLILEFLNEKTESYKQILPGMTSSHTLKGGVSIRQTQHYGVLLGSQYSGSLS